jgi:hypothetical protein
MRLKPLGLQLVTLILVGLVTGIRSGKADFSISFICSLGYPITSEHFSLSKINIGKKEIPQWGKKTKSKQCGHERIILLKII